MALGLPLIAWGLTYADQPKAVFASRTFTGHGDHFGRHRDCGPEPGTFEDGSFGWPRIRSVNIGREWQMVRKLIITVFAFLTAVPAFPNTRQPVTGQTHPALHLMNDGEFTDFLGHLDTDMLRAQELLKNMDVKSLGLDPQERAELEKSYNRCVESLDNTRDDIQRLSQKQTLKLDLFLLIELNELARNLDALDEGLVNPPTIGGSSAAQKSLGYAREVLGIDVALARHMIAFQHHVLAFTGVIDATLDQAEHNPVQPETQN
jgi:hypothetical protein